MTKYIDVNKLINQIKDLPTWIEVLGFGWRSAKYPNGVFDCEDVINSIQNQPTADVEELKHGEWVYDHWCEFKCSICGHWSQTEPRARENYCPNCGAKMDGGKKE